MTQWDFQNKGKSRWTGKSSFVLEVPLRHLRPSVIYSVPCHWILQRASFKYCEIVQQYNHVKMQKQRNETVKRIGGVPYWLLSHCSEMVLNA